MSQALAGIVTLTVAAGVTASCATSVAMGPPAGNDAAGQDVASDVARPGTRRDAGADARKDSERRSDGGSGSSSRSGAGDASSGGDVRRDGTHDHRDAAADVASPPDVVTAEGAPADGGSDTVAACSAGSTRACATSCSTTGTEACSSGAWSACAPPAEVCNLVDDDCDGYCDDILGCRIGVDRAYDSTNGLHFYTTTDSEASCCGYQVESENYYYLYAAAQTGLVPFYRCLMPGGAHMYTTDATCAGGGVEGSMGGSPPVPCADRSPSTASTTPRAATTATR